MVLSLKKCFSKGEPDNTGHLYGPNSVEVETVVKELDFVLENLIEKLRTEKMYKIENEIDILIVTGKYYW